MEKTTLPAIDGKFLLHSAYNNRCIDLRAIDLFNIHSVDETTDRCRVSMYSNDPIWVTGNNDLARNLYLEDVPYTAFMQNFTNFKHYTGQNGNLNYYINPTKITAVTDEGLFPYNTCKDFDPDQGYLKRWVMENCHYTGRYL